MFDISLLKSIFSNIWSIFLIVLFFGGSIFVHELGHFLAARKRGLIVERFSIGFGPKIASWKRNGTEYCISLLPLGGYVALPQMANMESIEGKSKYSKQNLSLPTFTDKILVLTMGVIFNLIFAFFLSLILWATGMPTTEDEQTTVIGYIQPNLQIVENGNIKQVPSPAHIAQLIPGDKILAIDGVPIHTFSDAKKLIVMGTGRSVSGDPEAIFKIERNGNIFDITLNPVLTRPNPKMEDEFRLIGISPAHNITLHKDPVPNSPAAISGLKTNDKILSYNGEKLYSSARLLELLQETKDTPINLEILRNNQVIHINTIPSAIEISKPLAVLSSQPINSLEEIIKTQASALIFLPIHNNPQGQELSNTDFTQFSLMEKYPLNNPLFLGLHSGDKLLTINNQPVESFSDFTNLFNTTKPSYLISFNHLNDRFNINIPATFKPFILKPETQYMLGIEQNLARELVTIHPTPFAQFKDNILMTFNILGSLISPSSDIKINHLMGPPGIARTFHAFTNQDLRLVIWFTIILNINLAILNLLPIPVLDGGHIVFAIIEKLKGSPIPFRFIANIQALFMLMLFSLMIYVSFNDIKRWKTDNALEREQTQTQSYYIQPVFKK